MAVGVAKVLSIDKGEEIIGLAGELGVNEYNVISEQGRRFQCVNCRKKIHCMAGWKKEGDLVVLIKDRCGKDCECKCRTHFVGKDGRLHRYGTIDTSNAMEDFSQDLPRNKTDDLIDEMNEEFKKEHT